jgi:hypothetical protein
LHDIFLAKFNINQAVPVRGLGIYYACIMRVWQAAIDKEINLEEEVFYDHCHL